MGGGTLRQLKQVLAFAGLSPRGRGNRGQSDFGVFDRRSIPAWAGEPDDGLILSDASRVYPRVGGGTYRQGLIARYRQGLSPRGRGNQGRHGQTAAGGRSIPAWAGEPPPWVEKPDGEQVYPRVGGGTIREHRRRQRRQGLSPRGRGNPDIAADGMDFVRSIPAWAGEPRRPALGKERQQVYPRVGGGTAARAAVNSSRYGLSPRGRGNPAAPAGPAPRDGSIPAWAGEPIPPAADMLPIPVYPRVGGGNRQQDKRRRSTLRSIPAWAGEPIYISFPLRMLEVYPRVGGGTYRHQPIPEFKQGLSPRGRGNRGRG